MQADLQINGIDLVSTFEGKTNIENEIRRWREEDVIQRLATRVGQHFV
jgi:hypothetical protein